MFESIASRLSSAFEKLTRKGVLTESDVTTAVREVRVALLEADVSLQVAKSFVRSVQRKATGQAVMKSVSPSQLVIKIVHDELVRVLVGDDNETDALKINNPPATVLMVGLQGSGKTTTTAKIAKRITEQEGKRVLMASLDTRRPAAMEQLAILGQQAGVETVPIVPHQSAVEIAMRARDQVMMHGYDILILDTAGRLHIDEELMDEVVAVKNATDPRETLLVVDGLTGQDAVNVAQEFKQKIGVTGTVLTRMDGDARGGAALSMRAVTGKPIKFVGTGEKLDALETFDPKRVAGRILGMGDIVALVERASQTIEKENTERAMRRFGKGRTNFNDIRSQLESIEKMGGVGAVMGMLPGMEKRISSTLSNAMDDKTNKRMIALIQSMTPRERANPRIIHANRRRRIAAGAGVHISELNSLLKFQRKMVDIGKRASRTGALKEIFRSMHKGPSQDDGEVPGIPSTGATQQIPPFTDHDLRHIVGRGVFRKKGR